MKPATTLRMPSWHRCITAAGLLLGLALAGCGGSGPAGAAGSSGTNVDSGITSNPNLTIANNAPGVVLAVTQVKGATGPGGHFKVGDKPAVTFTIKKTSGATWHLSEMASGRIWMSGPTSNYQRVIAQQSDLITRSVLNDDGSYTYTFASAIPANYLTPLDGADGDGDGNLGGTALLDGSYTIALVAYWNYNVEGTAKKDVGNTVADILIGSTATAASREVVKTDNCNQCHVSVQAHGGSYQDARVCVTCHTAGAKDLNAVTASKQPIEFKLMIHKIHDGSHLPSVNGITVDNSGIRQYGSGTAYAITGYHGSVNDFSDVNFPVCPSFQSAMPRPAGYSALASGDKSKEGAILKGVVACYKCHGESASAAPSQGDNCYTVPTRQACGSCHDDIDWTKPYVKNGMTMPANSLDGSCTTCHKVTGDTLAAGYDMGGGNILPPTPYAHAHPLADPTVVPGAAAFHNGLKVNVTGMSGSAASYFVAGEKPSVTFTIKDNDGADLPLYALGSISTTVLGPNNNRQVIFPVSGVSSSSSSSSLCDFAGRLVSSSTTNKGAMSRVIGSDASETLQVKFSSSSAFTVTAGSAKAARGGAQTLTHTTNTSAAKFSEIEVGTATAQEYAVAFTTAAGVTTFTVTGTSDGLIGSGTMAATTSATTRFTSAAISFTLTTTADPNGGTVYIQVFAAGAHRFAIAAGTVAFAANDRFYYETVDNGLTSYTYNLPMDLVTEYLGDGSTGVAGETFTAANLPVYWGRETVYVRTTLGGAGKDTTITADVAAQARFVTAAAVGTFAKNGVVVLDEGTASEEYLTINLVNGSELWFMTPMRYSHSSGATCKNATLSAKLEGVDYTLDPTTGVITTLTAVTAGNAVVISYRTDGAFGWYRGPGDTMQTVYQPPLEDSADLGQDWGEWHGLAYQAGSYVAGVWAYAPLYVPLHNETQTYRLASSAAQKNFRYGSAGTASAYNLVSSESNCDACHDGMLFHGGTRKGNDTCLMCHSQAGIEDTPGTSGGALTTPGVTVNFRTFLHKVHMGAELTNASTYLGGDFAEVEFPVMPAGAADCAICHGASNTAWKQPADRTHPDQTVPTGSWNTVCSSCHDSDATATHITAMTTSGVESCATCHGTGAAFAVDQVHKNR